MPTDLAAIRRRRACPRDGSPAPAAAAGAFAPAAGAAPRPPRPAGVRGRARRGRGAGERRSRPGPRCAPPRPGPAAAPPRLPWPGCPEGPERGGLAAAADSPCPARCHPAPPAARGAMQQPGGFLGLRKGSAALSRSVLCHLAQGEGQLHLSAFPAGRSGACPAELPRARQVLRLK